MVSGGTGGQPSGAAAAVGAVPASSGVWNAGSVLSSISPASPSPTRPRLTIIDDEIPASTPASVATRPSL